ncbi:hypothetical protein BDR04DRAFT_1121194 [Suillus decipiens]|nr:hypothetical protein BDR04DRAFT_1121194 [Suillus decipiens]
MTPVDDWPLGSDKGQICTIIAKAIFIGHPKYGQAYQHNQRKFHNVVSNHITNETGAGVMPLDGMASKNLLELDANPLMAAKTHLSKPGVDYAGTLYSLIQLHGAGPLIGAYNMPPPTTHPPGVSPVVHPYSDPPLDPPLHQLLGIWCAEATELWGAVQAAIRHYMQHVNAFIDNTSLLNSTDSLKKKAKSNIMQKVDLVWNGIESLQSSSLSCHESKHQWFLTKLDTKSEHQQDTQKYDWLHATCEHEAAQVALIHQYQQEDRDTEIHLCEVDIWVHEAHGNVLNKEAETLQLKIQFQQMMQATKDLGSDL